MVYTAAQTTNILNLPPPPLPQHPLPETMSKAQSVVTVPCKYKTGKVLGQGTYAVVKEAVHIETGKYYAVKVINKKLMEGREHMIRNEINVLRRISQDHKNILSLVDYFETMNNLYLVTELALGGELFDRICKKGSYFEKDAADLVRTITDAVAYLHDNGIVHRANVRNWSNGTLLTHRVVFGESIQILRQRALNIKRMAGEVILLWNSWPVITVLNASHSLSPLTDLKPENLLFRTPEEDADLLIADFGLSRIIDSDKFHVLTTTCGTPGYMAPEIFKKIGHGKPVDMWAIGVITFFLLCGYTPFESESSIDEMHAIMNADFQFDEQYWTGVSGDAKKFIRRLLTIDPAQRMTARQALEHAWLSPKVDAPQRDLLPNVRKNFNARRTFKKAVDMVRLSVHLGHRHSASFPRRESEEALDGVVPVNEQIENVLKTDDQ
ncbi:putative calmodulin-dependent protein kinase type 1 [Endogone sp. FLAS-F59071]|nr:putative calmodulin-dependent protein kinase type 1 [Endogone sp. FLAS-F59071]|eukprot:RUS16226.1 putative calmodulin-dependent protein kinase type 1 [Endogone sp. FLAS-F59071]